MGAKLAAIYEEASKLDGLMARVEMALMTTLSVEKAKVAPDSPENIRMFEKALATIKAKKAAAPRK